VVFGVECDVDGVGEGVHVLFEIVVGFFVEGDDFGYVLGIFL